MNLNYRQLLTKAILPATMLLAACHRDDPEPQPGPDNGLLSAAVLNGDGLPLSLCVYDKDDALVSSLSEPSPATSGEGWKTEQSLTPGTYCLLAVAASSDETEWQGTDRLSTAVVAIPYISGSKRIAPLQHSLCFDRRDGLMIRKDEKQQVTLQPYDRRKILRLHIETDGPIGDSPVEATLGGVARSLSLATGQPVDEATLQLSLMPQSGDRAYVATAGIAGIVMDGQQEGADTHELVFTLPDGTGGGLLCSEDITRQLVEELATKDDTLDIRLAVRYDKQPIHLYTGIRTRALVNHFEETPVCIAAGTFSGRYTESWEGRATDGEIILDPERYYPSDGSPLYLCGYYPAAPVENGEVHYTLTGKEDLMLTGEQSGSLADRFDPGESALIYRHLLAQLNFKLNLKGVTDQYRIRSVKLNGLAARARVNLFSGTVEPIGQSSPVVVYTDPGTGGFPVVDGTVTLPGYVLVQPEAELSLDLVLNVDGNPVNDKVFTDLPVNFTGGSTEGGNAYEVEISLEIPADPTPPDPDIPDDPEPVPPVQIKVTAKIAVWGDGDSGGVIV